MQPFVPQKQKLKISLPLLSRCGTDAVLLSLVLLPPWRTLLLNKPRVIQANQSTGWWHRTMKEEDADTLNPLADGFNSVIFQIKCTCNEAETMRSFSDL